MSRFGRSVSSCVLTFIFAVTSFASGSSTATLTGRVIDPNGAVIIGAKVDATNIDTNVTSSTETNSDGLFVISNLLPGRYRVFVQKQGFQTVVKPEVELHVQDAVSLNFSMQLGSITQSVTIEGGASLAQTETATVGTLVNRQFVENLPLNGRSFQSLIALTPGVVLTKATNGNQGQFSVNGQRANANYFTIDGVGANIGSAPADGAGQSTGGTLPGFGATGGTNNLVSVDALQEFKILTSTFSPEFGRTPGAQVLIATRSGTNGFHGTLFDYFRNDALDANDWFANSRGLAKPPLRQNDFGGVLGGPIVKNRTFFFFSYEALRLRLPQTALKVVPTLGVRQSAPASMQPYLSVFPIPNGRDLGAGLAESNATYSDPSSLDATSIRVDQALSDKLTLFIRYNYAPSESLQRGAGSRSLNNLISNSITTQTLTGGATLTVSPTVSNDFRANYSTNRGRLFLFLDDFGGALPVASSSVFPASVSDQNGLFQFVLAGNSWSVGTFNIDRQRQINLVDTLSIIKGAHQLKLGIDYRRLIPIFDHSHYGQTNVFATTSAAISGRASMVNLEGFEGPLYPVFNNLSLFGQDTWRATKRLTITYGLRWEFNPPPSESNGNLPFTVIGLENPATVALAPAGTPLYRTHYNNFAPRVGVAYQLSQASGRETVARGGFGIFYDLGSGPVSNAFGIAAPNSRLISLPAAGGIPFPLDPALAVIPPFKPSPPFSSLQGIIDPGFNLPYTYQWNVALEQSLDASQTISASYVAAVGRRLLRRERIAQPNPNFASGSLLVARSDGTSDYHSLQLQYQRRLSHRLQALASYTWAHSTDNVSSDSILEPPIRGGITNSQRRGPSDFDVRHSFSSALGYDIPAPAMSRFAKALLRDFSVDAIFNVRSATPVNVIVSTASFALRPDLVPSVPLYVSDPTAGGGRRINRAAFTNPPLVPGTTTFARQGTLGRNALLGFGMWQLDMALRRQFSLTERFKLQFRAEFFNLFNHPNFGDPGTAPQFTNALNSPQFGQSIVILSKSLGTGGAVGGGFNPLYQVGGARSIQLALKLVF